MCISDIQPGLMFKSFLHFRYKIQVAQLQLQLDKVEAESRLLLVVLRDGVDSKKLKLGWIREMIVLVSQEPILFATSIKENIAYGKENVTDQEIRTAIELANSAKFIDQMS
jgi:ABC-type phosphate transport system ATPase subunit